MGFIVISVQFHLIWTFVFDYELLVLINVLKLNWYLTIKLKMFNVTADGVPFTKFDFNESVQLMDSTSQYQKISQFILYQDSAEQ